jgi:predicted nucleotidyltransferase
METKLLGRKMILDILNQRKQNLVETYGITRLGIFGSVARGEATEISDVDVVVEMAPDLFMMVRLKEYLQEILDAPVDIVRYRATMNPFLKQRIDQEAVYV